MFKKLHLKLTGLCALITIAILFAFTALYLSVSERTLEENQELAFQHTFDSLCGLLEQQSVLSYSYLLQLESDNGCHLFLWDNGHPLTFNSILSHAPYASLSQELYDIFLQETRAGRVENSGFFYSPAQLETAVCGQLVQQPEVRAALATIYTDKLNALSRLQAIRSSEGLVLLVLAPQDDFLEQISRQRLLIGLLALAGCLLLSLFAFFFTGRLLRPIQENQEKQLQFIANASHELRTPLAVILSAVESRPPGYERIVAQEARRMGHLADELLTLTSLENRSLKIQPKEVTPDTLLLNLYEQWEPLAVEKKLRLYLQLPEEAIPCVQADEERLKQLLAILLQNALCYTPAGGTVSLKLFLKGRSICFQVIDNGIGISDQDKAKIFERFYRADSSRHEKNHFGLGLCLAKEIVLAHQGQLEVNDTPGGGSTFSCLLPINLN